MKRASALLAGLLVATGMAWIEGPPAHATAPCEGIYSIAVGGTGSRPDTEHDRFYNVVQHVGYPSDIPNGGAVVAGVAELDRLIREQRAACPGQHVKAMGYSLGAAVVHVWLTERGDATGNVNAILIADPKREALPGTGANGSTGPFGPFVGAPLAGTDSFFGSVPVKSICNWDYICDSSANPLDYPHNHIVNYDNDWDGNHHNDVANEYWWNNQWVPR
jgi:cutinase